MSDVSTAKSVFALAVVVGCFAILWPKIFYPMMQAAFRMTTSSSTEDDDGNFRQRPPHFHPGMGQQIPKKSDSVQKRPGRPPTPRHPGQTYGQPPPSSQGGIMGMVMPIYSVAVILFFFYTVFKVSVFTKKPDDKTPKVKNFNMDPEHRKFVFSEEYDGDVNLRRQKSKPPSDSIPEEAEEEEEEEDGDNNANDNSELFI
ncbi:Resistance to inhibitors of cholinesterase protein 3 [Nymphon striatum]|nr:Resistance to inhibitors of cholinesterase protein 3 [Nymphon striatum]KAG1650415.1 Resistance to inhibitors of cholinesterase protein 3 [Nymphon striatum]